MTHGKLSDEELNAVTGGKAKYDTGSRFIYYCEWINDDDTFKNYFLNGGCPFGDWGNSDAKICRFCKHVIVEHRNPVW